MSALLEATAIKAAICNLTSVEVTNQGLEVTLPQMYHSGLSVAVIVSAERDGFTVHDNSYAAMLLANLGISPTQKLSEILRPQIAAYGCELNDLRVSKRCADISELGSAMTLVGCASRLIADQALKTDRSPLHDFKSSLLNKIVEAVGTARVRTNEEVSGHLGSKYRVSALILDSLLSKPVAFVEPIADREAIARRFKQFYDLKLTPDHADIERIAVYDESNPIPAGDALLMQEVGNLIRFSDTATRFKAWATIQ